jgi:RNA polymerase sigma-70 factor (ECF subfamily)
LSADQPAFTAPDPAESAAVQAAVDGDGAELGLLLESFGPRLTRMVEFRMDERLRGRLDPQDVLQESFTEILERLDDFLSNDMDLFLWVRLQTGQKLDQLHRKHLKATKRDARREVPLTIRGVPGASSFALASAILDGGATPSRVAMTREAGQRVLEAIEGMKPMDREVLALRHFEQLTNSEVAKVLELSEPAATLRYIRAIKRLRAVMIDLELTSEALPIDRADPRV